MFDLVISIIVLAAIALAAGAFVLWRKGVTKQAMLMAILSVVMFVNVAIWLVPMKDGDTPMEAAVDAVDEGAVLRD
ncbi:hypothetical protein [Aurantiacibacter rhizosphaerae]|uniref:Uncharacterized protein n=1 Tax=Aurantiacibacter rhizosphaerae TaxID=2691582 RepID=A0A844XB61_9SPHN|nr:hypothetical protein [Aurantiacibacter rhizosphaerae]MWV27731.1 hypothetical protein [Aurantiacibacter rhizosphaerae]